jgi:hypothetical protein
MGRTITSRSAETVEQINIYGRVEDGGIIQKYVEFVTNKIIIIISKWYRVHDLAGSMITRCWCCDWSGTTTKRQALIATLVLSSNMTKNVDDTTCVRAVVDGGTEVMQLGRCDR